MTENWTNGQLFVATEEDAKFPWSCGKPGELFGCALCGVKFKAGDTVRWQYTNDTPGAGGNPFVCVKCDGTKDEIVRKIIEIRAYIKGLRERHWWFFPRGGA